MKKKSSTQAMVAVAVTIGIVVLLGTSAVAQESVVYSFGKSGIDSADGPFGTVIFDASGNIYGLSFSGGEYGYGAAFELSNTVAGWTQTVLHSFGQGADGTYPEAGLVMDSSGNFYGTTEDGGASNLGTVFELSYKKATGGWTEKVIHNFENNGKDGQYPTSTPILDANGNLYGTTTEGGGSGYGTVFELVAGPTGFTEEKILHSFSDDGTDGHSPYAGLVFDTAGNLYGTAVAGGEYTEGALFELARSGSAWKETIIHAFKDTDTDGQVPHGGVVFDSAGNLYGATRWGGRSSNGTAYELSPNGSGGWTEKLLWGFGSGTDGQNPQGGVLLDSAGNVYGTTELGGTNGAGIVFQLVPGTNGSWTENILHNFNASDFSDGGYPWAGLTWNAGILYGATPNGGGYGGGTAYQVTLLRSTVRQPDRAELGIPLFQGTRVSVR